MEKEITLKEAEKIVDDMYQKRWIECGIEDGNTIHMENLDKLQYSELERASLLLLRTEIRLQKQLKKQKEINQKAIEYIKDYSSYINYLSPDKHKEIGRLEAYDVKELLQILEDKEV